MSPDTIYLITVWAIPVIIAVTFHETAHGFVAHLLGDDTAWRLGRVSFNPFKHVDPFGTILLPGLLLWLHSPFVFGYVKPVPVNFRALRSPRRDMVAGRGGGTCHEHSARHRRGAGLPPHRLFACSRRAMAGRKLEECIDHQRSAGGIQLFPLPPLDGGRILVGILPKGVGAYVARFEPYGLLILIGVFIVLPLLGAQLGVDLSVISRILAVSTRAIIEVILQVTGNI